VTPRHDFIDFLLTEHLPACFLLAVKNNRLEKSVVQIYTKKIYLGSLESRIIRLNRETEKDKNLSDSLRT
jgi:hypothetical protein